MKPAPYGPAADPRKQKALKALANGKPADAARLLKQVCKKDCTDPVAWLALASAQGQDGNFKGVVQACEGVLRLSPNAPKALSLLGNAYASLGKHEEAAAAYRKALRGAPNDASIHNNLGHAMVLAGQADEAIEVLEKAVELDPGHADARHNLGKLLRDNGRMEEAAEHLTVASRLMPDRVETLTSLGGVLVAQGKLDMAETVLVRARHLKPDDFLAHRGLTATYRSLGRFEEALEVCSNFLAHQPEYPEMVATEAELFELMGDIPAAQERVARLKAKHQLTATALAVLLRLCRKTGNCEETVEMAEQMLATVALPPGERQLLRYSLGQLHDKLGHYDVAFENYHRANEMSSQRYDHGEQQALFDRVMAAFEPGRLQSLPRSSNDSEKPVFIVGMPRSGTTLCEQIIASHPDAEGAGELIDISHLVSLVKNYPRTEAPRPDGPMVVTEAQLNELADRYLQRLDGFSTSAARVTDKMPHNFQHLGLINQLFPEARIIHCVRDPLDTCLSIYFQNFNATHLYATNLTHLGWYYREYQRLMQHWANTLDIRMMTVHYAELVQNQERMTREIIDFIGLPWDERCLSFQDTDRAVATASYDQVRQKMYTGSLARWKRYEAHIGPLRAALQG